MSSLCKRLALVTVFCAFGLASCSTAPLAPDSEKPVTASSAPAAILSYGSIVHPVLADAGMVVSQNELATMVGRDILAAGGNAIDAAVATGFALAVALPRAGNLGGSGFMLVHTAAGETVALDFRSAAPAAYAPEKYQREDGSTDRDRLKFGAHVVGVPGTVAGLGEAWQRFGSLPWAKLLAPAERLAREGIVVSHDLSVALASEQNVFERYPSSRKIYLKPDGRVWSEGELWRQPDLANTLGILARDGADSFYRGRIAKALVAAIGRDGGYLSAQDLDRYRVRERKPLSMTYRDKQVVAMPPVSGGGVTLLQMLNVLQRFDVASLPQGSASSLHLLAETMKLGAANRRYGIGDPDFVNVPLVDSLGAGTADELAAGISLRRSRPVSEIKPRHAPVEQSRDTTHYSVVDQWGNAVATTYTLGYSFGSGYVAGDTGILLDNQLRNFSYGVEGHANAHAPGKRMMSTMTPTLVFSDRGQLELVTGTPGGGRIINVILQLLVNVIDYRMNLAEATHAPRIHQAWRSPELTVEPGFSVDTLTLLRDLGHRVEQAPSMGSTQSIAIQGAMFYGAADPRRPGARAAGIMKLR